MGKINAGEAPERYIAVQSDSCDGCAFDDGSVCNAPNPYVACHALLRDDGKSVIFVKRDAHCAPATLLHPMGSMGEEVQS